MSVEVAHSWCSLPVVESFGLMFGCLHARDNKGIVVVGFGLDFLPIFDDMIAVLDAIRTYHRFIRSIFRE